MSRADETEIMRCLDVIEADLAASKHDGTVPGGAMTTTDYAVIGVLKGWKQAFLRCCVAGAIDDATSYGLRRQSWWDDECDDVADGCAVLRGIGTKLDRVGLAKCLVALDYSYQEASDLACQAFGHLGKDECDGFARQFQKLAVGS